MEAPKSMLGISSEREKECASWNAIPPGRAYWNTPTHLYVRLYHCGGSNGDADMEIERAGGVCVGVRGVYVNYTTYDI